MIRRNLPWNNGPEPTPARGVPTGFFRAHRLIVILRRHEGMTFQEIGTILDLEPEVVERMYQMACDHRD